MSSRPPSLTQLEEWKKAHPNKDKAIMYSGNPIATMDSSLTAGYQGPALLQDHVLLEELARFTRERIPERVVHAKGAGAFGYFEVTDDIITKYSKARLFEKKGKRTNVTVRFSTVPGELGSADTARTTRGFATKFHTEDGIWDLVGQNFPVFFFRDPILFPSFMRVQKRNPVTNTPDVDALTDTLVLLPSQIHQFMHVFSGRGIPDSYRHMNGYGVHTFKLVNKDGVAVYCKFHLKTKQGIKNLTSEQGVELAGTDPDYHTRDLYEAIHKGQFPEWSFNIQVMTFDQAKKFKYNPFDETKTWPKDQFKLIEIGKLVLNKNPENYFADVEQAAFSPSNMVPGIEPSPSKLLHGRMFAYPDAQRYRLGTNYLQLPVNCPFGIKTPIANYHRNGGQCFNNQGGAPMYYPNSYNGPEPVLDAKISKYSVSGDVDRYNDVNEDNDYEQPREFWEKVLDGPKQKELATNFAQFLVPTTPELQQKAIDLFTKVHPDFGKMVQDILNGILKSKK